MTDCIITAAGADRLLIDGWKHDGAAAAGTDTALSIVGGDGITIRNFWLVGNFAVAAIESITTANTNCVIGGFDQSSYIHNLHADDVCIELLTASTGFVGPNVACKIADNAANITEALVGDAVQFVHPLPICNLSGESTMETNITASTDA